LLSTRLLWEEGIRLVLNQVEPHTPEALVMACKAKILVGQNGEPFFLSADARNVLTDYLE